MNAEQLLQHFELISEAPDAIKRLRGFILDLAVRGKLVEQEPADEPAAELLKRIAAEKARMAKAGDIKTRKICEPSMAEAMYLLPSTWKWVALGSVFNYDAGIKTEPKKLDQNLWLLELEDVEKDTGRLVARVRASERTSQSTKSEFKINDILYGKLRPYLNKVLVADEQGYSTTEIVAIRPYIPLCSKYCVLALRRPDFLDYVTRLGQGTKMPRLRTEDAKVAPFPLPPLAEQHRIVAKVDELMSLCDQLEAAKAEREKCRDSLVAASLQGLNQPAVEEETFREHARFTFNNLPRITTRTAHIKQLRQTILNLAVRGKLVEQGPGDEPAAELALMIKKRSRGQIQESIEPPFSLPVGWAWRAIDTLADKVTDGEHATPPRIPEPQIPLVTAKNVREGFMDYSKTDWVSLETAQKAWVRCRPQVGDLLLVCVGATTGRLTVLREPRDMVLVRSVALIRPNSSVLAEFLERGIRSPLLQQQIWASVKAAAQPCLYINRIQSLLIPLPPLAEQQRIVAKVDELMAICDQLEAQITVTEQDSRRFLESVLADALAPGIDLSAEAQVA